VAHQEQELAARAQAGDAAERERRSLGADLAHARAAVEQLHVRARSRLVLCVMGVAGTGAAQRPGAVTRRPTYLLAGCLVASVSCAAGGALMSTISPFSRP